MDEINSFCKNLGKLSFKTYKCTQLLHQITYHRSIKSYLLMLRNYACLCEPCLLLVGECENLCFPWLLCCQKDRWWWRWWRIWWGTCMWMGKQWGSSNDTTKWCCGHSIRWFTQPLLPNKNNDSFLKLMFHLLTITGTLFQLGIQRSKNTTYIYEDVTKTVSVSS